MEKKQISEKNEKHEKKRTEESIRFEILTRGLFAVPKHELDKQIAKKKSPSSQEQDASSDSESTADKTVSCPKSE